LDSFGLGYGPAVVPYEYGNEPSDSEKVMNFLTSWATIAFTRNLELVIIVAS
jgi:hypothetical protein